MHSAHPTAIDDTTGRPGSGAPSPAWLDGEPADRFSITLARIEEVCPIRETAQRVMELAKDEDASVSAIVEALIRDPALAAEVLRIANSPAYGQRQQVSDLQRAVSVIGMRELHDVAAAMSMLAAFDTEQALSKKLRDTSVLSATIASLVAAEVKVGNRSTAFLSGLLAEVGALACIAIDPPTYVETWERSEGSSELLARLERRTYGDTTGAIGAALLTKNKLPEEVARSIQGSALTPVSRLTPLARITLFARFAAPLLVQAAQENDPAFLTSDIPALAERFGIPIDTGRLTEVCLRAGEAAELGLRGEGSLYEHARASEEDEPAKEATAARAARDDDATERHGAERPPTRERAPTRLAFALVGAAIVLGGAAAAWLML